MAKQGKKQRKYDRNRKRRPSGPSYKNFNRQATNKKRRAEKVKKVQQKKAARIAAGKIKPRGLTRKLRRKNGITKKTTDRKSTTKQIATAFSQLRAAFTR